MSCDPSQSDPNMMYRGAFRATAVNIHTVQDLFVFYDRPGSSGGHAGWRRKDPGSGAFPPVVYRSLLDRRDH